MHREAYSQIRCFQNAINCCLMQPLCAKKTKVWYMATQEGVDVLILIKA